MIIFIEGLERMLEIVAGLVKRGLTFEVYELRQDEFKIKLTGGF